MYELKHLFRTPLHEHVEISFSRRSINECLEIIDDMLSISRFERLHVV